MADGPIIVTPMSERVPSDPAKAPDDPSDLLDELRCLVTVSRDHRADAQQRQVLARIDDGPVSTLMFGERFVVEVKPGEHLLRANNTLFWKRVTFTIEPGEHLEFQLINQAGRFTLSLLVLLGVAPLYLRIERRSVL